MYSIIIISIVIIHAVYINYASTTHTAEYAVSEYFSVYMYVMNEVNTNKFE